MGEEQDMKPNIVLINCDDLGYGDLACYGSKKNRTPALDKMAEEGIRFTHFYMASPICSPSRGAMMTGCYPPRIGFGDFDGEWVLMPGQGIGIHEDEKTLPQYLKELGYSTKHVGKWHCGDQPEFLPTERGFDEYFGLPYSNDMGRQKGDYSFPPLPLLQDGEVLQQQPDQRALTERYTATCVDYIRRKKDEPFFLYFAHMYVHLPVYVPAEYEARSQNGRYGAAVEHVDWSVRVLLHELKELGIDENTIVIFTSDNGSRAGTEGGSNAPLRGTKGSTWEGGMRLPCIIRWPEKLEAGQTSRELVSSIDLLPTLVELAGGEVDKERKIDGLSFASLLTEKKPSPRDTFFYYFRNDLEAVRKGKWKLHLKKHVKKDNREFKALYDLEQNPDESKDVYDEHPELVRELEALGNAMMEDLGDDFSDTPGNGRREHGTVPNPKPLTEYDPEHPYIIAMYDLEERG